MKTPLFIRRAIVTVLNKTLGSGVWMKSGQGLTHSSPWPGAPWNWWQLMTDPSNTDVERSGTVYSCMKIISEDMSRIPIRHKKLMPDGSLVDVRNQSLARVMRKPNQYQTKSDLLLYMMRSLLLDGNSYTYAPRNGRQEINALYPLNFKACWPYVEPQSGEIFYQLSQNSNTELIGLDNLDGTTWLPARDILHIRLHTPKHPLVGESPLVASIIPAVTGMEINKHTADFFRNMGRPSGILRHPGSLSTEAMGRIKARFKELISSGNTGEPIVLRDGMDWTPLTMNAVDSELIKSFSLTERQISQAYRVPPFLLGDLDKATMTNVESLTRFYLQSCLGFYVDHLEEAFTVFFGLPTDEMVVFDLEEALLRGDFKERMDGYAKAVQSGVFAPNEARAREKLPPKQYGDEPRVQQQLVPLSYGAAMQPPVPAPEPEDDTPDEPEDDTPDERAVDLAYLELQKAISA